MPAGESNLRRAFLLVGALAAGFLAGHALPSGGGTQAEEPEAIAVATRPSRISSGGSREAGPARPAPAAAAGYHSDDTLDVLMTLHEDDLYPRLALWLVDADAADMEACWLALSGKDEPNTRHLDLLFCRWTDEDPHAAIRAAAGTRFAHIPWWAWSKNQPRQAFDYAVEHQRDQLGAVLRGIGQSEPEMALRLLDQHPELKRENFLDGILSGLAREDPEAATKLAFKALNYYDSKPLEAWLRDDPHAALAWFAENRQADRHGNYLRILTSALERENPELLPELAASLPSGNLRRELEAAHFRQLALADPEKALEEARQTPSDMVAAERLSQVATLSLETDPERALEIFAELLDRVDYSLMMTRTHPSGRALPAYELVQRLGVAQPEAAMEIAVSAAEGAVWSRLAANLAQVWAADDPHDFAEWSLGLENAEQRDAAISTAVSAFAEARSFEDAAHLVPELEGSRRRTVISQLVRAWQIADPAAAAAWLESAPLSEGERHSVAPILKQP